jgi:microcystin-dependent protein
MPLLLPHSYEGLDAKIRSVIEDIVARVQAWAGQVDGINAAERLNELTTGIAGLPTVPTGFIAPWPTATAPTGYLLCNGGGVSRATYATLFALIGTTYGAGDGSTTFNIPDLRGKFVLGKAASGTGSTLAGTGGAIDHTHSGGTVSGSTANESAHTHGSGSYSAPEHATFYDRSVDNNADGTQVEVSHIDHIHGITGTSGAGSAHSHGAGTLAVGTSGTANPPFMSLNYVIKT